jgi:hypothetical protein
MIGLDGDRAVFLCSNDALMNSDKLKLTGHGWVSIGNRKYRD